MLLLIEIQLAPIGLIGLFLCLTPPFRVSPDSNLTSGALMHTVINKNKNKNNDPKGLFGTCFRFLFWFRDFLLY
jgi:hypothetical protein